MTQFIYLIIIASLSIISHFRWFFISVFSYHDWRYSFPETIQGFTNIANIGIWNSLDDFGIVEAQLYFFPFHFLSGLLSFLPHVDYWSLFFVYLLPIVLIPPIATFFLFRRFISDDLAVFVGVVAYIFSTSFLGTQSEHLTIAMAYTIAPLLLLTFVIFLQDVKNKKITFIFFAIVATLAIIVEPRIFYIILLFLLPGVLFVHKFFGRYLLIILIVILLNLFWILPIIYSGTSEIMEIVNRPLFGNSTRSLMHGLSNMSTSWSGARPTPFELQPIPVYMWFVSIFVFSGLFFIRKQEKKLQVLTIFIYFIALIGIFLIKQSHDPFPEVYGWLYEHFPGFHLYRESSKFYILTVLSYAYLITFSFFVFSAFFKEKSFYKYKLFRIILGGLLMTIFLFNATPLISGKIGAMFVHREIDEDYFIFKDFVLNQNEYFRTQGVPRFPKWGIKTSTHPSVDTIHMTEGAWKQFSNNKLTKKEQIEQIINSSFFDYLLDVSSIKYVFVPIRDFKNDADFFIHYGGKDNPNIRKWYINLVNNAQEWKKIDIGTKTLVVYENEDYKPFITTMDHLYMFDNALQLNEKYNFIQTLQGGDVDFVIEDTTKDIPAHKIQSILSNITIDNISNNKVQDIYTNNENSSLCVCSDAENKTLLNNIQVNDKFLDNNTIEIKNDKCMCVSLAQEDNEDLKFTYNNDEYDFDNQITNASFEDGLWSDSVGDCNNYDDNGLVSMNQSDLSTDGDYSLELHAITHSACTSQGNIDVDANNVYLFSFDYQSDNANHVKYHISFDDGTAISEEIPVMDSEWHKFTRNVKIPKDATRMRIFVYSDSDDSDTSIVARYDNFNLIKLPDIINKFYLVSNFDDTMNNPQDVYFDTNNSTKHKIHIKSATDPFYLVMSEKYHDKWQMQFDNEKVRGMLQSWMPFVHPDIIPETNHFRYMTFLNGWYIDTQKYCENSDLCKHNDDGSYDMDLVIEFFPQRWLYLGLFISSLTLITLIGYIVGYLFVKILKQHK